MGNILIIPSRCIIVMRLVALLSFIAFFPAAAFALQMNEIMYDLPGTDTGHEWVEVWQDGTDCVNLTQWKLFEANTNHGITLIQGEPAVCSGGYAVIADNPTNFLNDHIGFGGNLFDSAFSLSNTGETLALKNPDGNITDSVAYSNAWGASGNGKSLESNSSGWFESLVNATPGAVNSIVNQQSGQQPAQNQTQQNPAQNATQNNGQTQSQNPQTPTAYQAPANYSPLIDFSIIGRSNRVPPGSSIEVVLSASSNYVIDRAVSFCSYALSGNVSASDESCRPVTLPPDTPTEVRLYNTLKSDMSGNLTLLVELRDSGIVKTKSIGLEVLSTSVQAEKAVPKGPTGAFVVRKTNVFSEIAAKMLAFFESIGVTFSANV